MLLNHKTQNFRQAGQAPVSRLYGDLDKTPEDTKMLPNIDQKIYD